jgi:hypothetical protein
LPCDYGLPELLEWFCWASVADHFRLTASGGGVLFQGSAAIGVEPFGEELMI